MARIAMHLIPYIIGTLSNSFPFYQAIQGSAAKQIEIRFALKGIILLFTESPADHGSRTPKRPHRPAC